MSSWAEDAESLSTWGDAHGHETLDTAELAAMTQVKGAFCSPEMLPTYPVPTVFLMTV